MLLELNFFTQESVQKILVPCRKPKAAVIGAELGIPNYVKYETHESSISSAIINTFSNEDIIHQYKVGSYIIDLYFPRCKLAIEIDEQFMGISHTHCDRRVQTTPSPMQLKAPPLQKTGSTCRHTRLSKSETCTGHKAIMARPRAHKPTTSMQACQAQAVVNKEKPNQQAQEQGANTRHTPTPAGTTCIIHCCVTPLLPLPTAATTATTTPSSSPAPAPAL